MFHKCSRIQRQTCLAQGIDVIVYQNYGLLRLFNQVNNKIESFMNFSIKKDLLLWNFACFQRIEHPLKFVI